MDILICRLLYPNDPTNTLKPHQHFVGLFSEEELILYSISSVLGKEKRVFALDGSVKPECFIIGKTDMKALSLRVPSFIDCSVSFHIKLNSSVDITMLSNRSIPYSVRERIENQIIRLKERGNHRQYSISLADFLKWNKKCKT